MKNVLICLAVLFAACHSPEEKYDRKSEQLPVLTHEGIDSVLAQLEAVRYNELDEEYKVFSASDGKFKNSLKKETFYIVRGDDVLKYIVGEYRIKNFLAADNYYFQNEEDYEAKHIQYWLVDKKMLYMMLDLILRLEEEGYNKYGFMVRESHRHPKCNALRGGASSSQHIWGKAVDIVVKDINNDGRSNQADKTIVLEIMEEIVGNKGGIGKYPGTMTVHFDSRGKRARWDAH